MSNSIWKTGDPKYEHDRCFDDIILEYHRKDGSKFYIVGHCSEPNDRWAYLSDIIAQADKAERLQEAVDLIANMEQRLCIDDPVDILDDVLKIAKDEIKKLTQGNK